MTGVAGVCVARAHACEYGVSLSVELRYKDVDYTGSHCSTPHVAALAMQALKAPHTCPLISEVEDLIPSSWLIKLSLARNPQHSQT